MSKEAESRKIIIEYSHKLYDKGFMPGIDGNISMKVDENTALVTPAGVCKGNVTEDELVLMNLSGEKISGHKDPSSETPMHLAAYINRPEVNAVIHAHSPNAVAFAMAGKSIDTRSAPFAYEHLGLIGNVEYSAPGFPKLHEDVVKAVKKGCKAILLGSHGPMVLGAHMQDAYEKIDLLEAYAQMLFKATLLGGAYVLTDEELIAIFYG